MAYEKREGDIALFQNKKADPSNKQPTMKGDLLLNGITYEVACWTKLTRDGDKFLAGNAKVKQSQTAEKPKSTLTEADVTDSEIPF